MAENLSGCRLELWKKACSEFGRGLLMSNICVLLQPCKAAWKTFMEPSFCHRTRSATLPQLELYSVLWEGVPLVPKIMIVIASEKSSAVLFIWTESYAEGEAVCEAAGIERVHNWCFSSEKAAERDTPSSSGSFLSVSHSLKIVFQIYILHSGLPIRNSSTTKQYS